MKVFRLFGWFWFFLIPILFALANVVFYFFLPELLTFFPVAQEKLTKGGPDFNFDLWRIIVCVHLGSAALSMILGPFQFLEWSNRKHLKLHRLLGKLYVAGILISATPGFYLSLNVLGGPIVKSGFFVLNLLWVWTTFMLYYRAREKKIESHKDWVLRSYAVTLSAVSLRIVIAILTVAGLSAPLPNDIGSWASWILNVLIAEWIIRSRRAKKAKLRSSLSH